MMLMGSAPGFGGPVAWQDFRCANRVAIEKRGSEGAYGWTESHGDHVVFESEIGELMKKN